LGTRSRGAVPLSVFRSATEKNVSKGTRRQGDLGKGEEEKRRLKLAELEGLESVAMSSEK